MLLQNIQIPKNKLNLILRRLESLLRNLLFSTKALEIQNPRKRRATRNVRESLKIEDNARHLTNGKHHVNRNNAVSRLYFFYVLAQPSRIVENCRFVWMELVQLTSFLVDRIGAEQTGFSATGSGRRESYKFAPASRMRNTFIEPGDAELDDMVASIDKGIYASHMGGGSVQPGTGEFNFAVTEGYYIEHGKIKYPVKAATLISTGPAVLKEISMVGKDFSLACGMCGSVSGSVPTSVGQATLKVDDILVGGNA